MLWDDAVAEAVTLGKVIPAAKTTAIVVEMSTLSPQMYSMLDAAANERNLRFMASPVLGSVDQARLGQLTVLAGGDASTVDQARPLLACLGTVLTTGSPRASGFMKLANNVALGIFAEAEGELLELCARAGLDRRFAIESITGAFERASRTKRQQLRCSTACWPVFRKRSITGSESAITSRLLWSDPTALHLPVGHKSSGLLRRFGAPGRIFAGPDGPAGLPLSYPVKRALAGYASGGRPSSSTGMQPSIH